MDELKYLYRVVDIQDDAFLYCVVADAPLSEAHRIAVSGALQFLVLGAQGVKDDCGRIEGMLNQCLSPDIGVVHFQCYRCPADQ